MQNTENILEKKFTIEDVSFSGKYSKSVFKTIYMSIYKYRFYFIIFFIIGFIGRFSLLYNANLLGKWIDHKCYLNTGCEKNLSFLISLILNNILVSLLVLTTIGFLFSMIFRICVARMGTYSTSTLYDEVTKRVSLYPISFFDTNPLGRIITRFSSDYSALNRMSGGPLGEVLSLFFDLILFCFLILAAGIYFTPVVILALVLNYTLYRMNLKTMRKTRRDVSLTRGPVLAHFAETVQGAKIIRVMGKQINFKKQFLIKLTNFNEKRKQMNFISNLFALKMSLLNIFIFLVTGLYGFYLVKLSLIGVGSLSVAFTFVFMISSTIQLLFEWIASLEEAFTGAERLDHYLNLPIEKGARLSYLKNFNTNHKSYTEQEQIKIENREFIRNHNASLEIKNLTLRYSKNLPIILDNVSLKINSGEKIGIIGKTGSGKSSLIQSIFHMYPFESGEIEIDSYLADLDQIKSPHKKYIPLEEFRRFVSLISQDPVLYTGSLRENLIIGNRINDEEIIDICEKVGLKNFIMRHKKPLDFFVYEKGLNLSLGERQLICMARCLLQKAPIVLMDEATSSIDPYTEEMLLLATKELLIKKTQIIVAHRLSTVETCDRIFWIDSGKIKKEGSPLEVLSVFRSEEFKNIN